MLLAQSNNDLRVALTGYPPIHDITEGVAIKLLVGGVADCSPFYALWSYGDRHQRLEVCLL